MKDIQTAPTYKIQTQETARWLGEDLGLDPEDVLVGY